VLGRWAPGPLEVQLEERVEESDPEEAAAVEVVAVEQFFGPGRCFELDPFCEIRQA